MQPHQYQLNSQPRKNKISLQKNTEGHMDLAIDKDLVTTAINRSYLKSMAKSGPLEVQEMVNTVAVFAMSFIPEPNIQKQLQQFWCIVALSEQELNVLQTASSCRSSSIITSVDVNKLKLYQLFIGLGTRELRFQSLESSDKLFIVNMDTVETVLASSDIQEPNSQNRIRLIVAGKYNIGFFFTKQTLPYGFVQNVPSNDCQQICFGIARHTFNIIKQSILQSKGTLYNLKDSQLPHQDFYHHRYATEQQFSRFCQTGDIILFRDNHTFAKVQRFFTNSQCDHIGIVFKDDKYGLCIFESNSGTGVTLAMWNQLIRYKWYENIEGIYWRRLNMQNKPANFQEKVKQFVKVNLHKQYGISLGKLLSLKEIVYEDPNQQKNRTYFCSELAAALYKYLGLLEPGKPSSTYLPKDFTDKGSLNMINNTALEAERRLIFNEKILKETYRLYK